MSHIFHIAPDHYFIFFGLLDGRSMALSKNKWQSGFAKCVTIDYSTFNYMNYGLQIMLEIDFFWWQGCSYFECIYATKMKTQSRRMLLVRNVWDVMCKTNKN